MSVTVPISIPKSDDAPDVFIHTCEVVTEMGTFIQYSFSYKASGLSLLIHKLIITLDTVDKQMALTFRDIMRSVTPRPIVKVKGDSGEFKCLAKWKLKPTRDESLEDVFNYTLDAVLPVANILFARLLSAHRSESCFLHWQFDLFRQSAFARHPNFEGNVGRKGFISEDGTTGFIPPEDFPEELDTTRLFEIRRLPSRPSIIRQRGVYSAR